MKKIIPFLSQEALNLSVGYLAGLIASGLVSRFFVERGFANLWGLAAKRNALQKDTYEWVMVISAYLIGLIVMLLVQYAMRRLRGQETVQVEE